MQVVTYMHSLPGGNYHTWIREKMPEFSSTVLLAPSPYRFTKDKLISS